MKKQCNFRPPTGPNETQALLDHAEDCAMCSERLALAEAELLAELAERYALEEGAKERGVDVVGPLERSQ